MRLRARVRVRRGLVVRLLLRLLCVSVCVSICLIFVIEVAWVLVQRYTRGELRPGLGHLAQVHKRVVIIVIPRDGSTTGRSSGRRIGRGVIGRVDEIMGLR